MSEPTRKLNEYPTPRVDGDERSYPLPTHLQLIQFEGATCGVLAPEEYEELYEKARQLEQQVGLLRERLELHLTMEENADETGYVTDVGFINLDAEREITRLALELTKEKE